MKLGIDILRHFLTIFVILQHMTSSRYSIDVNAEISSYEDFIDGAVAGFFIISGYYSKKQTDLLKFTRLLAIRLLVPFFIFSVTYTLILFALDKSSLSDGLYKTITLHGAGMQLYFLPYLLVVSFSFAIIRYITDEKDTIRDFDDYSVFLFLRLFLQETI
jgi:fucose 4-O-acetylase-like acetyltransferase